MTFEQALIAAGLLPRHVAPDGRWHRCATVDKPKKRNGAFKLSIGGGRGWFRNWATDPDMQVWDDDCEREVRPVDMERIRQARERERAYQVQAMRSARAFWADSSALSSPHPYITKKKLAALGCAGLRINDGLLVVPVWSGEWIVSVQTIAADGTKRFWPGAPVKGGAYLLDRPRAAITAVCEGLATGLAVFQAVRHARVIVAFDAGNLLPVVQRVNPAGTVVICADNDWRTAEKIGVNVGLEKARNAAELIGCGVAYPQGIAGSDWADALVEWGEGSDKRIAREIQAAACREPVS